MEVMQFGKFRGMMICDIPTDYLQWGAKALKGGIQRQFATERESRTGEVPRDIEDRPGDLLWLVGLFSDVR